MLNTGHGSCRERCWKFRDQAFYAERGQVHICDDKSGDYRKISIKEFILRCRSFQQRSMTCKYADEREELIRMCEAMIACARLAKSQGSPHSDSDRAYITRHRSVNRIMVPGTSYNQQHTGGQKPKIIIATR